MLTNKQKLEYALKLRKIHELMIIKENLYFAQSNANHNKAVHNLETLQDRIIANRIDNHIDGNVDPINHKPIVEQVMNTALVNQRKGLSKTKNKKIDKMVKSNIKSYQNIMNNRLKLDAESLDAKIEKEIQKKKYNNLSNNQLKYQLKEEFKGTTKKRINRIIGDALHTNQCNISFVTAQEQGYKYKTWNNGRGKGRVRPWHRAKLINSVELDDKFYIYGSYPAYMMYPGDLDGGAENVANCRCWLSYTNITPSNLKTKGSIKINSNVQLTQPNTVSSNKNTVKENKGLVTNAKNTISSKVKTVINKVKNKINDTFKFFKNKIKINSNVQEINENNFVTDNQVGPIDNLKGCKLESEQINYQTENLYPSGFETNAVVEYGNEGHNSINYYLINGKVNLEYRLSESTIISLINNLDSVMDKSPGLVKDTKLFHHGSFDTNLNLGDKYIFKDFRSTSYQLRCSEQFKDAQRYKLEIFAPKGTKGIVMNDKINFPGTWTREHEYLLPRNQECIVLDVDHTNKTAKILLI